jgi:hypothetical protein
MLKKFWTREPVNVVVINKDEKPSLPGKKKNNILLNMMLFLIQQKIRTSFG